MDNVIIDIPKTALTVLNKLNENGYLAYIVGGCVRDSLLGDTPKDWDITTDATPEEIKKLFPDSIPTGEKYGTITVKITSDEMNEDEGDWRKDFYEVTTFRYDQEYSDGRRPDSVIFGKSILDDLARRDFTINAMAYSPLVGLVDPYNGLKDLNDKIIRCVGNPSDRLKEDALRILRGIRFACKYDFKVSIYTKTAMQRLSYLVLENVSKERVHDELIKILDNSLDREDTLKDFMDLFKNIFDLIDLEYDNLEDALYRSTEYLTIIFLLFHYSKKRGEYSLLKVEEWARRYKFSNSDIKELLNLIKIDEEFNERPYPSDADLRKLYFKYKNDFTVYYNILGPYNSKDRINEIIKLTPENIEINGTLIKSELNIGEGKLVGKLLKELTDYAIEYPEFNTTKDLLEHLKYLIKTTYKEEYEYQRG